ncbi:sensor histidine kinase [Clostridium intestinale]|uniref:Two-component system, AgrA family, sensor histidine kinase AgrC n=1 Tax=Clostridium intestinale DSM 6191 TaxID=1121320 RepID=A0A1M6A1R7_9CLOT|nr:GHKL domain-containing protein [Clostridium intestinale]SHI30441.1 two-component system, AgrA family, sensor histidine kinase AgrC [Clostridium intestinale DSM 6191]
MPIYIQILITVLLIYVTIINLVSYKLSLKDLFIMILAAELIAIPVAQIEEFLAVIPMIVITGVILYKYDKNLMISIIIPIGAVLIGVVSDYIVSNTYISLFGINVTRGNFDIGVALLEFFICITISKGIGYLLNKKIKLTNINLKGRYGVLIVLSLLLTLIIFYTNIYLGSKAGFNEDVLRANGILFLTYFILLGVILFVLIRSLTKELEFRNKQKEFENLKQYTESLEKLYSDMRVFRHDYINIISSMIGYIDNRDMDGLERHFYENIIPVSKSMQKKDFKIGAIKNIDIPEIKGIVSSKLIRAQELGLDVHVEVVENIDDVKMNIIDLSRILGILLDNAIEASKESLEFKLKLAFIKTEKAIIIVISNSYKDKNISLNKIFKPNYSTKGSGRGIGLNNLKKIIDDYDNVFLETKMIDNYFIQELQITNT